MRAELDNRSNRRGRRRRLLSLPFLMIRHYTLISKVQRNRLLYCEKRKQRNKSGELFKRSAPLGPNENVPSTPHLQHSASDSRFQSWQLLLQVHANFYFIVANEINAGTKTYFRLAAFLIFRWLRCIVPPPVPPLASLCTRNSAPRVLPSFTRYSKLIITLIEFAPAKM